MMGYRLAADSSSISTASRQAVVRKTARPGAAAASWRALAPQQLYRCLRSGMGSPSAVRRCSCSRASAARSRASDLRREAFMLGTESWQARTVQLDRRNGTDGSRSVGATSR